MSDLMTRRDALKLTALTAGGLLLWPRRALAAVKRFAIVYKLRGGKNPKGQRETIAAGSKLAVSKLKHPYRKGYRFRGWYKDEQRKHAAHTLYGKQTLRGRRIYAEWSSIRYQITLHLNGGMKGANQASTYIMREGAALKKPYKAAHLFKGWYADKGFKKRVRRIEKGSTGAKTFYAKWIFAPHWKKEIAANAKTAVKLGKRAGEHGDQFIFITDLHWKRNYKASPPVINKFIKKTGIDRVICGGDIIDRHRSSRAKALNHLYQFRNSIDTKRFYFVRGNHDNNTEDNPNASRHVTNADLEYIFLKPVKMKPQGTGKFPLYYCFDNSKRKIRYIILDTGHPHDARMANKQLKWLKARILELPSGWTALVFMHKLFSGVKTYDKNGKLVVKALDSIYDEAQATIAGVISGHLHADRSEYSAKGYPLICTTCDAAKDRVAKLHNMPAPNRKVYTKNEQAFDVVTIDTAARKLYFTRVGWGKSRTFAY